MNIFKQLAKTRDTMNSVKSDDLVKEMTEEELKLVQQKLLEMYLDILEVCESNGIKIALGGGSALGAIRHKGFIPWDDDLDLNISRKSYKKFVSIFEEQLSDRYILYAPNYKDGSQSRFPKILKKDFYYESILAPEDENLRKLFIDIFIMEFVPENPIRRKLKGTRVNLLEFIAGVVYFYENNTEVLKNLYLRSGKLNYYVRIILGKLFSFKNTIAWNNLVDKAVQYNKKSKYVCFPTGRKHYFGEILEYKKLYPLRKVEFEGNSVPNL